MRLVNLTIRNFRGFGAGAEEISLDGDLLLFFGPNGFGKPASLKPSNGFSME